MEKKNSTSKKVRVSLMITEDLYIRFRLWCVKNRKTFSGGVEYVLEKFLEDVEGESEKKDK